VPTRLDVVTLRGSDRRPLTGGRVIGPVDPAERIEVSVVTRSRSSSARAARIEALGARPLNLRPHLTRARFREIYGAGMDQIGPIETFAARHNLEVLGADPARRTVELSGRIEDLGGAFGVKLERWSARDLEYRGRTGPIILPAELGPVVQGVFGLDDRPQAVAHLRGPATIVAPPISPAEIGRLYGFPSELDGGGETIAIVNLGGRLRPAGLHACFDALGLPTPNVVAVSVDDSYDGAPEHAGGPEGDVTLEIAVAGALAPAATIVVYSAPNTDRGFLDALTTAIHDQRHRPSVVSIAWGAAECEWTQQAMRAIDEALQAAALLGITVLAAAGDDGARDQVDDGLAHVDFPASSPHVLACGGTRLALGARGVTVETAWGRVGSDGAGGGGVSNVFRLPSWQADVGVPLSVNPGRRVGRGVPDVAASADPAAGYQMSVDGVVGGFGGTGFVATLWAGLIACLNQRLGRPAGYLNPLLYRRTNRSVLFRDIAHGPSDVYPARPGWDAHTGLGSPRGGVLIDALAVPFRRRARGLDLDGLGLDFDFEAE